MRLFLIALGYLGSINVFAAKLPPSEYANLASGKYRGFHYCTIESGLGGQRGLVKSVRCGNPTVPDGVSEISLPGSNMKMFLNDGEANIGQWRNGGWTIDATWISEEKVIFMLSK